jgi:hypothetical protein
MKMKKLFMLCFMTTVFAVAANAQASNVKFSLGGNISSGNFSGGGKSITGFGLDLSVKKDLNESFEGFLQTGYNSYSENGSSVGVIPVLVGANYKAGDFKPGIGMGYGRFQASGGNGIGGFAFSPQLGYSLEKVDLVAHYTSISLEGATFNIVGLKVLYNF